MIRITLNDKIYQDLMNDLAELEVKEMIEQKWYIQQKKDLKDKIKARYNLINPNIIRP